MQNQNNDGDPLISIAQAAAKIGVNRSTLARQVADKSVRSHGGKVRLSEVLADRVKNIDLSRSGRRAGRADHEVEDVASPDVAEPDATDLSPAEAAAEAMMLDGKTLSYADARALKETYLAWLRRIEHDILIGRVVLIEDVVAATAQEYAIVRNRLLAMPSRIAARLSQVRSAETARAMVEDEVHQALAEVSARQGLPDAARIERTRDRFRKHPRDL